MTFTEAALEVLRRSGKPLHFKDIAALAVEAGLLSHVGQTPEATMGSRLLSLARREHDRKVVATDTGMFGLVEWGHEPAAPALEAAGDGTAVAGEDPYRARERHPPLQDEFVVAGRRDERRRRGEGEDKEKEREKDKDKDEDGKRRRRYGPPAELAHQWLRERGEPAMLAEIAAGLRTGDRIAEALERDLESFGKALKEENRRRQDGGRAPLFQFEKDGSVRGLEIPKDVPREPRRELPAKAEKPAREEPVAVRPIAADEQRRAVIRSVRRRLGGLEVAALERSCVALLEAQGYRELNLARRSVKEGPLYLARHKWGAGELRYAVRILKPGRDLGRAEVQDVRRDLGHYSAQLGLVIGVGECSREAKAEANIPNTPPVMLYGSEALAEALVDAGLGTTKRLIEWLEYDDAFFASMGAGDAADLPAEPTEELAALGPVTAAPAPAEPREGGERGRRGRDRDRRPRRVREGEESVEGVPPAAESAVIPAADEAVAASEPAVVAEGAPPPAASSEEPPPESLATSDGSAAG